MKAFQSGTIKDGKLTVNNQQFLDRIATLPDGNCLIVVEWINPNKTIREYQKEFHAKRDFLCREQGYSRDEMKKELYTHVLEFVLMDRENRNHDDYMVSTKELSLLGWKQFIESMRLWAWSTFECYL
jgi:hypothetical protein